MAEEDMKIEQVTCKCRACRYRDFKRRLGRIYSTASISNLACFTSSEHVERRASLTSVEVTDLDSNSSSWGDIAIQTDEWLDPFLTSPAGRRRRHAICEQVLLVQRTKSL